VAVVTREWLTGYVEVTVAAAVVRADGSPVNGDMADLTFAVGFHGGADREFTAEQSQELVRINLTRVAAAIETMLLANGAVHLGQVEDPMTGHGTETSRTLTDPIRVQLVRTREARA
jgi:hypothetical protein